MSEPELKIANLVPMPPQVDVDVTEKVTDAQAAKALSGQGVEVGMQTLRDLRTIGIYVRGQGVTHTQYGTAVVNQQKAGAILSRLTEIINDYSSKRMMKKTSNPKGLQILTSMTTAFTGLMKAMTDSQEFMRKLGGVAGVPIAAEDEEPRQNKSFRAGTVIIAKGETHVHEQKQDLPKNQ